MARKDTQTGELFSIAPSQLPIIDLRAAFSVLVAQALAQYPGDRYAAAAEISRHAGKCVTKSMLDGYTAESREEFNLPGYLVPAFEKATQTRLISTFIVLQLGGRAIFGPEVAAAELGKLEYQKAQLDERIRNLKKASRGNV